MSTSEAKKRSRNYGLMTGFILAFGLIYECFSYGVYAPAMYLAFLIPLLGGLLPSLILWSGIKGQRRGRIGADPGEDADAGTMAGLRQKGGHGVGRAISSLTRSIWDAAVLTLTLGSLMSGVLAIYGTSNRLIRAYWLAAGGLTALALFSLARDLRAKKTPDVSLSLSRAYSPNPGRADKRDPANLEYVWEQAD